MSRETWSRLREEVRAAGAEGTWYARERRILGIIAELDRLEPPNGGTEPEPSALVEWVKGASYTRSRLEGFIRDMQPASVEFMRGAVDQLIQTGESMRANLRQHLRPPSEFSK